MALPAADESIFPRRPHALRAAFDAQAFEHQRACNNQHVTSRWVSECIALRKVVPLSDPSNCLNWVKSIEESGTRVLERAARYRQLMEEFGGPVKAEFYEFLKTKVGGSFRASGRLLSCSIQPSPLVRGISSIGTSDISARCSGGRTRNAVPSGAYSHQILSCSELPKKTRGKSAVNLRRTRKTALWNVLDRV